MFDESLGLAMIRPIARVVWFSGIYFIATSELFVILLLLLFSLFDRSHFFTVRLCCEYLYFPSLLTEDFRESSHPQVLFKRHFTKDDDDIRS
jgi:hypothetical protein